MAIAHDVATVSAADYTATGSQTTSHAGSASARAAVVIITMVGSADQVSGVTYGGAAMTRLRFDTETTEAGGVYIYWLDGIATGTQNVVMTTTGTAAKRLSVSTMTVASGLSVVVASHNTATSTSAANPSVTLTGLTSGSTLSAYLGVHSGLQTMTTTPGASWTNIVNADRGNTGYGQARQQVASSGTTLVCNWTAATADDYVISAVAFIESLTQTLTATGIAEEGGVGTPVGSSTATLTTTGIAEEGGVGTPVANTSISLTATGIAEEGGVGTPVSSTSTNLTATGIAEEGGVGTPVASTGPVTLTATGIAEEGGVGTPVGNTSTNLTATGIAEQGGVGTPVAAVGAVTLIATGIAEEGGVGTPVGTSTVTLTGVGIAEQGGVGTPISSLVTTLVSVGIAEQGGVGVPVASQTSPPTEFWGFLSI